MIRRIKLIILLNILFLSCSFCKNISERSSKPLVEHYNNWLKSVGLDQFVLADQVRELKSEDKKNGGLVLSLSPAPAWNDPQRFASAWNEVRTGLAAKGINIDNRLLQKFADYTFSKLENVSIELTTGNPDIFSLKIYYTTSFKKDENIILGKGAPSAINFNFNEAVGAMRESCFIVKQQARLDIVLRDLDSFFKRYPHRSAAIKIDSIISHNKSELRLRVSNIYGEVTGQNYHEIIYLDVSMEGNEICYTVDASYAAGITKTPDPESTSYREVALDFPQQWLSYRDNLDAALKSVLHEK
jgi:hypothetical protein